MAVSIGIDPGFEQRWMSLRVPQFRDGLVSLNACKATQLFNEVTGVISQLWSQSHLQRSGGYILGHLKPCTQLFRKKIFDRGEAIRIKLALLAKLARVRELQNSSP